MTCRMPLSVDRKRYVVIFVEFQTLYMLVFYLIDKTTESFVYALRELNNWVRARIGPGPPLQIHGDSDRAWTITGRGNGMLPEALAQYFDDEGAMLLRRSPGSNQQRNPAESSTGRLNNNTFANQMRGRLGVSTWTDMMRGASNQINDGPCVYGGGGAQPLMSRSEALLGRRPDYSARWPGYPGQPG